MKTLQLPKMSTDKPKHCSAHTDNGMCTNHLHQNFNQKAPDLVWASDITYIKAGGKWYYLCIVMDLFSRKIIAWHIAGKADADLTITTFRKAYQKRNAPYGLLFHSDRGSQYTAFSFRQLLDSLHVVQSFPKKGILLTMRYVSVFSNISKRKKRTGEHIITYRNYRILSLNISKGFITPEDHIVHSDFLLLMRLKSYTGSSIKHLFSKKYFTKACPLS